MQILIEKEGNTNQAEIVFILTFLWFGSILDPRPEGCYNRATVNLVDI